MFFLSFLVVRSSKVGKGLMAAQIGTLVGAFGDFLWNKIRKQGKYKQ